MSIILLVGLCWRRQGLKNTCIGAITTHRIHIEKERELLKICGKLNVQRNWSHTVSAIMMMLSRKINNALSRNSTFPLSLTFSCLHYMDACSKTLLAFISAHLSLSLFPILVSFPFLTELTLFSIPMAYLLFLALHWRYSLLRAT